MLFKSMQAFGHNRGHIIYIHTNDPHTHTHTRANEILLISINKRIFLALLVHPIKKAGSVR